MLAAGKNEAKNAKKKKILKLSFISILFFLCESKSTSALWLHIDMG